MVSCSDCVVDRQNYLTVDTQSKRTMKFEILFTLLSISSLPTQDAFQRQFLRQVHMIQGLAAKNKDFETKDDEAYMLSKEEEAEFHADLQQLMSQSTIGKIPLNVKPHERVRESLMNLRKIAEEKKLSFSSSSATSSREKANMNADESRLMEQGRLDMDRIVSFIPSSRTDVDSDQDGDDFSGGESLSRPQSAVSAEHMSVLASARSMFTNDDDKDNRATLLIRELEDELAMPPPPTPAETEAKLTDAAAIAEGVASGLPEDIKAKLADGTVPEGVTSGVAKEEKKKGKKGENKRGAGKSANTATSDVQKTTNDVEVSGEIGTKDSNVISPSSSPPSSSSASPSSQSSSSSTSASPMATESDDISAAFDWEGSVLKKTKLRLAKSIDEELMTEYTGLLCPCCDLPCEQSELDDHGKCFLCRGNELQSVEVVEEGVYVPSIRRAEYEKRRAALALARVAPYTSTDLAVPAVDGNNAATSLGTGPGQEAVPVPVAVAVPGPLLGAELNAQGASTTNTDASPPWNPINLGTDEAENIAKILYKKLNDLDHRTKETEKSLVDVFDDLEKNYRTAELLDGVIVNVDELKDINDKCIPAMTSRIQALEERVAQLEEMLLEKFGSIE